MADPGKVIQVTLNWPRSIEVDLYALILSAFRVWDPASTVSNLVNWSYDLKRKRPQILDYCHILGDIMHLLRGYVAVLLMHAHSR